MKDKLTGNVATALLVVLYIIIVLVIYVWRSYVPERATTVNVTDNLKVMNLMEPDTLKYIEHNSNSSSTYYVYRNMAMYGQQNITVSFIGTSSGISCDTCSLKWVSMHTFTEGTEHSRYYIRLPFWKLKENKDSYWYADSVKFHIEDDKTYIRKPIITTETKQVNGDYHNAYLIDIPVKFRYDKKDGYILIPVDEFTKKTLEVILTIVAIALGLFFLYLVACFLNFIFDLSKGLAFTDNNISRLKLIALALILYPISVIILNFLMKLVFYNYFIPEVVVNKEVWVDSWKPIGAGLIFLLLYRAFKQGKSLKDEQDLTV